MYAQIEAQVAWGKVVQARLRPKVIISERDIDAVIERLKRTQGSTEYLAAEIYLPFDNAEREGKALQLANRLVSEIRSGKASFFTLAQQFSKSAGSSSGGNLGWLPESQVDPDILKALKKTPKNKVTSPIRTPDGFHIMLLRDKRSISEGTMPSRDQINYNLGTQRLNKLQRRHLMDIKAASFIEIRV
jgi:peptidyl-prolyl cis-trans isomerase SurA